MKTSCFCKVMNYRNQCLHWTEFVNIWLVYNKQLLSAFPLLPISLPRLLVLGRSEERERNAQPSFKCIHINYSQCTTGNTLNVTEKLIWSGNYLTYFEIFYMKESLTKRGYILLKLLGVWVREDIWIPMSAGPPSSPVASSTHPASCWHPHRPLHKVTALRESHLTKTDSVHLNCFRPRAKALRGLGTRQPTKCQPSNVVQHEK